MTEYCLLIGAQYSVHQDSSQILSSPDPSLHAELGLLAKLHIYIQATCTPQFLFRNMTTILIVVISGNGTCGKHRTAMYTGEKNNIDIDSLLKKRSFLNSCWSVVAQFSCNKGTKLCYIQLGLGLMVRIRVKGQDQGQGQGRFRVMVKVMLGLGFGSVLELGHQGYAGHCQHPSCLNWKHSCNDVSSSLRHQCSWRRDQELAFQ